MNETLNPEAILATLDAAMTEDEPKRNLLLVGGPPDLEARMKAAGADTSGIDFRPALPSTAMAAARELATAPDTYPAPALTTEEVLMDALSPKFPAYFWDMLTKGKAAGDPPCCPRCSIEFTSWKARRQHMRANPAALDACT